MKEEDKKQDVELASKLQAVELASKLQAVELASKLQAVELASKLQADEVVQYLSQRHHVSVDDVLACFTMQADGECQLAERCPVELEENEIQIIHDLIRMYQKKSFQPYR